MLGVVRTDDKYKLIVFENKYGNGAIGGAAGLCKNYEDIVDVLSNPDSKVDLFASVIHIARIKMELGLLRGPLDLRHDMDLEILFLMAGFNMKSQAIEREVRHMHPSIPARIIFPRCWGCGD